MISGLVPRTMEIIHVVMAVIIINPVHISDHLDRNMALIGCSLCPHWVLF